MAAAEEFERELVHHIRDLRAFARTFHRDAARADDLVQEAILKAWSNHEKFQQGTNMRAWLFTILRNTFLSEMRKKRREVEDVDGVYAAQLAEKPRQDHALEFQDFRRALVEIPEDQREALILVGASGFSYEEAAEICDCAVGTIKSRVNRARKRLAEVLDVDGDGPAASDATISAALSSAGVRLPSRI